VTEAQTDTVIALLMHIAATLDAMVPPEAPVGCDHPEDRQISLSTFGDPNHWVCGVCRFDNKSGGPGGPSGE
jgi:hypothetical protein